MTPFLEKHQDKWVPEPNSGCYLWLGALSGTGYPQAFVLGDGPGKMESAHRIVCEEAHGLPDGDIARHKCNVKICVNDEHIVPGSYSQNEMDKPRNSLTNITKFRSGFLVKINRKYVGTYLTLESAIRARDDYRAKL